MAFALVFPADIAWYIVSEDGPATETSCPGVNLSGGEVAVYQINSCSDRIRGRRVCLAGGLGDAYRTSPNGKPRKVTSMAKMGSSNIIHSLFYKVASEMSYLLPCCTICVYLLL